MQYLSKASAKQTERVIDTTEQQSSTDCQKKDLTSDSLCVGWMKVWADQNCSRCKQGCIRTEINKLLHSDKQEKQWSWPGLKTMGVRQSESEWKYSFWRSACRLLLVHQGVELCQPHSMVASHVFHQMPFVSAGRHWNKPFLTPLILLHFRSTK